MNIRMSFYQKLIPFFIERLKPPNDRTRPKLPPEQLPFVYLIAIVVFALTNEQHLQALIELLVNCLPSLETPELKILEDLSDKGGINIIL